MGTVIVWIAVWLSLSAVVSQKKEVTDSQVLVIAIPPHRTQGLDKWLFPQKLLLTSWFYEFQ